MAENTISAIVPDIYEALDIVSRELTGLIPAVTMNASSDRAGINQNIVVDVEPAGNVSDITPSMTVPEQTRSLRLSAQSSTKSSLTLLACSLRSREHTAPLALRHSAPLMTIPTLPT